MTGTISQLNDPTDITVCIMIARCDFTDWLNAIEVMKSIETETEPDQNHWYWQGYTAKPCLFYKNSHRTYILSPSSSANCVKRQVQKQNWWITSLLVEDLCGGNVGDDFEESCGWLWIGYANEKFKVPFPNVYCSVQGGVLSINDSFPIVPDTHKSNYLKQLEPENAN